MSFALKMDQLRVEKFIYTGQSNLRLRSRRPVIWPLPWRAVNKRREHKLPSKGLSTTLSNLSTSATSQREQDWLFQKDRIKDCKLDSAFKSNSSLKGLALYTSLTQKNATKIIGPLMSTFGTEQSSQDSLIYSVAVGKKSDWAKRNERVINRKVFTTNVENIQTYLSELNLDRIAENVLPDAEASECNWIFQTSGTMPSVRSSGLGTGRLSGGHNWRCQGDSKKKPSSVWAWMMIDQCLTKNLARETVPNQTEVSTARLRPVSRSER